ncbi:RNA-dependent RNA polymerase [Colletotrichum orchidophilum]|uniref:RNA-dependent RNA polymerase n=1 Tax=Colletotrichum orchidophilum TaxID=1209926 RepID=A0A1G4BF66_9PEZI|nr:RNA-dependent RNA polymerase [Colletotrichum orchidophilum]OHF00014.1 RNA-dependent RNA polymerase [Colletotrichum orchidophilum]
MEVFLTNLPPPLTDRTLEKELKPHMNTLGILEWSCSSNSSRSNKKVGWITFLHQEDGKRFLGRHGKQTITEPEATFKSTPRGRMPQRERANLMLMNTPVWAQESNKLPDPFMLKSLAHRLEEKHRQRTLQDAPSTDNTVIFNVSHLACGHNSFGPDQTLTFNEQCRFSDRGLAKFGKRKLILKFDQGAKVEIPYSSVVEMIHSSTPSTFTLLLSEPPRFYRSNLDFKEAMERLGLSNLGYQVKSLVRELGIPGSKEHLKYAGTCLVYQLGIFSRDFDHNMISLKKKELFVIAHSKVTLNQRPISNDIDYHIEWTRLYVRLAEAGSANKLPFGLLFQLQSLVYNNFLHPRSVHTMLLSLEKIFQTAKAEGKPEPISEQAFRILHGTGLDGIPFPCHNTDPSELDPDELLKYLLIIEKRLRSEANVEFRDVLLEPEITDHHAWVYKAIITPTRIILQGPDLESLNRVLRRFPNQTDYFMRVTFADEDVSDLVFNSKVSYDKIFERYKHILNNGLSVAGRVYQFLGFSHSSLRSHSAWFSAPFVDDSKEFQMYANIIKSLGDFEKIQIPAKCAARIGQAFSETPSFISISNADILHCYMPDIKTKDGHIERVFSDGVGTISREALELIWPRLPRGSFTSTCLQIRWGGVKGMLSLDSRLQGRTICIRRESMEKFPSTDLENLEICDVASRPLKLVLNRQMIKILEDLGVSNDWFFRLQKMVLDRLRAVTADAYNTGTFLHLQGIGTGFFLPSFIKGLDKYGIDYRQDRFLRAVVESVVLRELRLLKHKARIPVPKGATLFGIMDETRFLQENEVYVCFDTDRRPGKLAIDKAIKDGTQVLVTRSPALHPGDIQLAVVKIPPAGHPLRDLRNCIAFSQCGKRDLPSKLSGGDLDGDLYNIIWDQEARPKCTYGAADYPRVIPEPLGRPVTREDMANWFVDFMKSDVLGMIANRHLILADQTPKGTMSDECIKLAELHSTAVDFSKTGIPVPQKGIPKAPNFRPDFLAPAPPAQLFDRTQIDFLGRDEAVEDDDDGFAPSYRYYKSDKILGELYRNVDEKQIWDTEVKRAIPKTGPSVWDQFVGLIQRKIQDYTHGRVSWGTKLKEAKSLRDVYEDRLASAMTTYSDSHLKQLREVEVFCGSIFNKTGSQTRRQKDNSMKLKQEFDRLADLMAQQMRRKFRNAGDQAPQAADIYSVPPDPATRGTSQIGDELERLLAPNKEALEMSYACFMVGLLPNTDTERGHQTMQLESFKVISASVLLKELTELANRVKGGRLIDPSNDDAADGDFRDVSGGPTISYAYSGYDVDVGQYPNYGYSKYL